jgi:hypothetical protein
MARAMRSGSGVRRPIVIARVTSAMVPRLIGFSTSSTAMKPAQAKNGIYTRANAITPTSHYCRRSNITNFAASVLPQSASFPPAELKDTCEQQDQADRLWNNLREGRPCHLRPRQARTQLDRWPPQRSPTRRSSQSQQSESPGSGVREQRLESHADILRGSPRLGSSRRRVKSFSSARKSVRAFSHSSWETTGCRFRLVLLSRVIFVLFRGVKDSCYFPAARRLPRAR